MRHDLPLLHETFESVNVGLMRAVVMSGLDIETGDTLHLMDYMTETGVFTGRWIDVRVTHAELFDPVRDFWCYSIDRIEVGASPPYTVDAGGTRHAAA